jgi:hypothetical protein
MLIQPRGELNRDFTAVFLWVLNADVGVSLRVGGDFCLAWKVVLDGKGIMERADGRVLSLDGATMRLGIGRFP